MDEHSLHTLISSPMLSLLSLFIHSFARSFQHSWPSPWSWPSSFSAPVQCSFPSFFLSSRRTKWKLKPNSSEGKWFPFFLSHSSAVSPNGCSFYAATERWSPTLFTQRLHTLVSRMRSHHMDWCKPFQMSPCAALFPHAARHGWQIFGVHLRGMSVCRCVVSQDERGINSAPAEM